MIGARWAAERLTSLHLPRNAQLWLPGYIQSRLQQAAVPSGTTVDILLCIADHFEPGHGRASLATERARVRSWMDGYPKLADRFRDADGCPPQHTFFYPADQYRREHLDELARLCTDGLAEVEIHLHHDADTRDHLRKTLNGFKQTLSEDHGLLTRDERGAIAYAFVHGNWALDNASPDGRWCGVNDELSVLRETGCYADFTLPAAPTPSQTRIVNAIYHAAGRPGRSRAHDTGTRCRVGSRRPREHLLLIQGPLALDWRRPRWGLLPGLDVGAVDGSSGYGPNLSRFRRWVELGISVVGRSEWVFVKLHTHGAPEPNMRVLLGHKMASFHEAIGETFNDGRRYRLHYVTAREMANIVMAAEAREHGNAGAFRDYVMAPPPSRRREAWTETVPSCPLSPDSQQAHGDVGRCDDRNA